MKRRMFVVLALAVLTAGTAVADDGGGTIGSGTRSGYFGSGLRTDDDGGGTIGSGTSAQSSNGMLGSGTRTEDSGLMGSGGGKSGESKGRLIDLFRAFRAWFAGFRG